MGDHRVVIVGQYVITCDGRGCARSKKSHEYTRRENPFSVSEKIDNEARAEGWELWVSRSRRWYCPNHQPTPGHNMRKIETRKR